MAGARTAEARFPTLRGILGATLYALELAIIAVSYFAIATRIAACGPFSFCCH